MHKTITIDRHAHLSKEQFSQYHKQGKPVIVTEEMAGARSLTWTLETLKAEYGDIEVQIQTQRKYHHDYEWNKQPLRTMTNFGEFCDLISLVGLSNDVYMIADNRNLQRGNLSGLLKDCVLPEWIKLDNWWGTAYILLGPRGTYTPVHFDSCALIMAHIFGRKQWRLFPPNSLPYLYNHSHYFSHIPDLNNPDYDKFPLLRQANCAEVICCPGDILYVPFGWWHEVTALDISLSLSFTDFDIC